MATPETPPTDPVEQVAAAFESVARRLFSAWRRALSIAYRDIRRVGRWAGIRARHWSAQWAPVARHFTGQGPVVASVSDESSARAAAFGVRAFAFGMLAGGAITVITGDTTRAAVATVLVETVWAVGRFVVCAALLPPATLARPRLATAYLAGLAPYAFGVTGLLRVLALAASALFTIRGLHRAGVAGRDVRTAVAWAFGGQALVVAFGFALRGGLIALLGT